MYDEGSQKLKCSVVVYDEAKNVANATNYSDSVANKKVQEAIRIVNSCHATKTTLMDICDFLASDSQVITYFRICVELENSFTIEMRDENEDAICKNEEPKK